MDRIALQEVLLDYVKKYRYILLVILCGIFLMAYPSRSDAEDIAEQPEVPLQKQETLQTELETLLSQVEGAGKVHVLLTQAEGALTLYQTDEDVSTGPDTSDITRKTVIVAQTGLIRQINPPVYLGAVVICQGGNDPVVRLAVVDAVADATGLTSDRITVLKMK